MTHDVSEQQISISDLMLRLSNDALLRNEGPHAIDLKRAEDLAITREHYFAIARGWVSAGEIIHARMWAEKLINHFAPQFYLELDSSTAFSPLTLPSTFLNADSSDYADLMVDCGMIDLAERLLTKMEEEAGSFTEWLGAAAGWRKSGREKNARRCLRRAEKTDDLEADDWFSCAEEHLELEDHKGAARCLKKARAQINSVQGFVACARIWRLVEGGNENVQLCIDEAFRQAEDCQDWLIGADLLIELDDKSRALDFIRSAEQKPAHAFDLMDCARALLSIGETEAATACLKNAESLIEGVDERSQIACAWLELGDVDQCKRLVQESEANAETTLDWLSCLNVWNILDETLEIVRCAERATERASDYWEWTSCAREWVKLEGFKEAHKCLKQAEAQVDFLNEWHEIAGLWGKTGNEDALHRALSKAEDLTTDYVDWLDCADAYANWGQSDQMLECLEKALSAASSVGDFIICADKIGALNSRFAQQACYERAILFSRQKDHWAILARAFRHLDAEDKYTFCLKRAGKSAAVH